MSTIHLFTNISKGKIYSVFFFFTFLYPIFHLKYTRCLSQSRIYFMYFYCQRWAHIENRSKCVIRWVLSFVLKMENKDKCHYYYFYCCTSHESYCRRRSNFFCLLLFRSTSSSMVLISKINRNATENRVIRSTLRLMHVDLSRTRNSFSKWFSHKYFVFSTSVTCSVSGNE